VSKRETLKNLPEPVEIEKLSITENVSSDDRNIGYNVGSYTQGRIAGDFLSSRKAAQAERCPPKTTAAALDG
jgi:hypothetical protein